MLMSVVVIPKSGFIIKASAANYHAPISNWRSTGLFGFGTQTPSGTHLGMDFSQSVGSNVHAVLNGRVVLRSNNWWAGMCTTLGSCRAVVIEHQNPNGQKFWALYGHVNPTVSEGATVSRGQVIGTICGATTYPFGHLHFGINTSSPSLSGYGNLSGSGFVNPVQYLDSLGASGHDPQGYFDRATGGAGTVNVIGWAFDRDDVSVALRIHVYIGGEAGDPNAEGHFGVVANLHRPDVNNRFPGVGNNHGFNATLTTAKRGSQNVYIYAINVGGGNNTYLGMKTVNITNPVNYAIIYNLNGGINAINAPTSYTFSINTTLPTPTRIGHTFGGWFTSANFSDTAITSTGTTRTGTLVLYAKWIENVTTPEPCGECNDVNCMCCLDCEKYPCGCPKIDCVECIICGDCKSCDGVSLCICCSWCDMCNEGVNYMRCGDCNNCYCSNLYDSCWHCDDDFTFCECVWVYCGDGSCSKHSFDSHHDYCAKCGMSGSCIFVSGNDSCFLCGHQIDLCPLCNETPCKCATEPDLCIECKKEICVCCTDCKKDPCECVVLCGLCGEDPCVCVAISNVIGDATATITPNMMITVGGVTFPLDDPNKLTLTVSKVAEPENTEKFFAALKEFLQ
jgi:uncharacterized repeat protein (TIGR02543 family)